MRSNKLNPYQEFANDLYLVDYPSHPLMCYTLTHTFLCDTRYARGDYVVCLTRDTTSDFMRTAYEVLAKPLNATGYFLIVRCAFF